MPPHSVAERSPRTRVSRIRSSSAFHTAGAHTSTRMLGAPFVILLLTLAATLTADAQQSTRSSLAGSDHESSASTKSTLIGSATGLIPVRGINSDARDNAPLISADGRIMFFNSTRRGTRPWAHYSPQRGRFDDDIYYSTRVPGQENEEIWSEPVNLGPAINTSEDDGVAAITPDGRTIFFVSLKKGWDTDGGPFYRADLHGTEWSNVHGMGGGIAKFFNTNPNRQTLRVYGASISPDGKDFYFATTAHSDGDRHQIWISHLVNGQWKYPENLGPNINQPAGSYAPFIAADGRTLFFTTRMAGGSGGDDIHYSTFKNGIWEAPVNIGSPINTSGDDAFLSIPASASKIYLSTSRGGNDDIYATVLPEQARPQNVVLLSGTVINKQTAAPIEATVTIEDLESGTKIFDAQSDSSTGAYTAVLYAGRQYGISVSAPGYVFLSTRYTAPAGAAYTEINESFALENLAEGRSFVLNNIFFDYGLATITSGSKLELDRLIDLLKEKNSLKITVDGYTDNIGSPSFNQELSVARASAVRDYLVAFGGIAPERIEVRGFGVDRPVAPNDSEDGRKKNRRVEFNVRAL
jgi:outer membrane protein OmpA-like peptidoglycan-associated protein/Tol biopolymer transport system component